MDSVEERLRRRFFMENPQALGQVGGITGMVKPNIDAVDKNLAALDELARQVEDDLIELHQRERQLAETRSTPETDEARLRARYSRHIG